MINTQPALSKNGKRRVECTTHIRDVKEKHLDGKVRLVRRARFHMGKYLDRSKYKP